ncbi:hypothetical protein D3C78_1804690 [compost metagenome]
MFGVVPVRQRIETVIDHRQGIAQVLLAVCTPGQIGEVGRDASVFGGVIMFVERNALDGECWRFIHGDGFQMPECEQLSAGQLRRLSRSHRNLDVFD